MLAGKGVSGPVVGGVSGPVVGGVSGPVVGGVSGPVVGGVSGPVVGGVSGRGTGRAIGRVASGVVREVSGGVARRGTEAASGEEAGRVMEQMAHQVASRVLEESARCLLWEKLRGVQVSVCRQAAGGVAGRVAFGVTRRTGEGAAVWRTHARAVPGPQAVAEGRAGHAARWSGLASQGLSGHVCRHQTSPHRARRHDTGYFRWPSAAQSKRPSGRPWDAGPARHGFTC